MYNNLYLIFIHLLGLCIIFSRISISLKLKSHTKKDIIIFIIGILLIFGVYKPTKELYITSYEIYKIETIYSMDKYGELHKNLVLATSNGGYLFDENSNYKYSGHGKQLRIYKNIHFWGIKGYYKYVID